MSDVIERVRCTIPNSHVFKLPARTQSGGWRGADWTEEVWQGTTKVVERGDKCAIVLAGTDGAVFAVCPFKEGAVERCVDSSRYFVLRIENAQGRHMFIGLAFNERNDSFDFNTALEDSKREKEQVRRRPWTCASHFCVQVIHDHTPFIPQYTPCSHMTIPYSPSGAQPGAHFHGS